MRLTVIPSDSTMIMNGRALVFPFITDVNLHAIQWYSTFGFIETTDGKQVKTVDVLDVQPFIDAFIAHAAVVDAPPPSKTSTELAAAAMVVVKAAAAASADRITEIRGAAVDALLAQATGSSSEKAAANIALGSLRGVLASEKAKL